MSASEFDQNTPGRETAARNAGPTSADDQYRRLVQSITEYAIYMLDPTGIVTSWNPGAEHANGYTEADIIGRNFAQFFTAEDQARGRPAEALAIARSTARFEAESWRVRKDGSGFWACVVIHPIRDENGGLLGFANITRDMTKARAAQEALQASEQHLRLLTESIVDYAIFTLDAADVVTSWNPGAERAKRYARAEIIGQHFSRFFTADDQSSGRPAHALAVARATGRFEDEGWRVRKDGARFWASVVIDAMRDENGQIVGFAKVTRDISDKRALAEAKEQLHQAQKMETVGQLTGGVAHDFNNLLTAVMGSLELVARLVDDDKALGLIATAQRAAGRGAKLTSQLLAFSRRQILSPQTSNVNDLVVAFESLLRRAGGEAVSLRLNLDSRLWLSDVDQAQFQSALLNFVVNARDAMPKGGTLIIETRNAMLDSAAAAELTEIVPGPFVVVTVRDTGEGMTPEVMNRAVEPFYTTKDVGRGSGLGLSQAYGFVRQSNGQMKIESQVGIGTSISLYLPRSTSAKAAEAEPDRPPTETSRGTVLVVEDDPDVLEIAAAAVKSFGYEVHLAQDAETALTILQREPPIDCLFTDVVMPRGMNGVELAREARRLQPTLRILLASGYPRKALEEHEGVNDKMVLITKPYTLSALNEGLRAKYGDLANAAPASGYSVAASWGSRDHG